jgi:hypothetical protein
MDAMPISMGTHQGGDLLFSSEMNPNLIESHRAEDVSFLDSPRDGVVG